MEARKRLQAAKVAMKKDGNMKETFNGGFFKVTQLNLVFVNLKK